MLTALPLLVSTLPGVAIGGASGAAGAAAAAGGGSMFGSMALGAGLAGLAGGLFGGSSSGPAMASAKINLTPAGKELEKKLFGVIKDQHKGSLFPDNLAAVYAGREKRAEGERARSARAGLQAAFASPDGARGNRGLAALITEGRARIGGLTAPAAKAAAMRSDSAMGGLTNLQNLMNIELQVPLLKAAAEFDRARHNALRKAAQGQMFGDIANFAGMAMMMA